MSTVETEQVLVVPTALFHDLGYFQGFSQDVDRYVSVLLDSCNIQYRPRGEMEQDPDFKQLIPYVIFQYNDEEGTQLFHYTRGKGQGESRLHSKMSIGVGGHISSIDADTPSVYDQGMQRELEEETIIDTTYTARCVGLINDDETDVGKVHLGIVHIFEVDRPDVFAREQEIIESGFSYLPELFEELSRFESWSQICLDALYRPE